MPRRLTLVIHSLDGGGAEKTMALMANRWVEMGHGVTLITLDSVASDRYDLAPEVTRVGLNLMSESRTKLQGILSNVTRVRALRRAIANAQGDAVICFTETINVLVLMACRRLDVRVIACERTDPRFHSIGRMWSFLRRRTYQHAKAIVVQTNPIREFVQTFAPRVPIHVVPNCIWLHSLNAEVAPYHERPRKIVAVGRLVEMKGFHLLIDAFSRIASEYPEWSLTILGDGPAKSDLQSQITELDLQQRVTLFGWSPDPGALLREAQVFVMSSQYEGFPNALLEAMAWGIAPVSFDCESGPREIIRHEVDGLLVPSQNVEALAQAMHRLLADDAERSRFADRALEVRKRFSEDKFFETWDRILGFNESSEQSV